MFTKISQKGFTLVELLVVVLIIGLLVSLAVPKVGDSLKQNVRNRAANDLLALNTAIAQVRATYPTVNFNTLADANTNGTVTTDEAFNTLKPFLNLPANVTLISHYNLATNKGYYYRYDPAQYLFCIHVNGSSEALDSSGSTTGYPTSGPEGSLPTTTVSN